MPRRAVLVLLGAGASAGLLLLAWYAAFHIGLLGRADRSILHGFLDLHRPRVDRIANFIAGLCNPQPYAYLAAVPVLVALARRRPRSALAIGAILFGANATAQLLKPMLAAPRPGLLTGGSLPIAAASWPSGHATAAMSLALGSVLAAPQRLRPAVAALGAGFAVAVSYSFLTLGWHYPSDVLGGFLIAATWTQAGVAGVLLADHRRPGRTPGAAGEQLSLPEALGPPAAALLGVLAFAGLVALARPHAVLAYAREHAAFMVGAATIGALGLALATGVMLALRR